MKVFVSAPYTENLETEFLSSLESILKEADLDVVVPHKYVDEKEDIEKSIKRNFKLLDDCDMILADVTKPSHGVGMEILYAHQKGKKIIFLRKAGTKVSHMALFHANELVEYNNQKDLKENLLGVLKD